ncbi:FSH1-domain-containing protein [Westerdykella ornata]|uniref:FSH1-domain-containing protein n=1 Tax=Westerdykella ornata TaxID=318751 RepID=A0A6A6JBQ8_WESOR|nr:FSH1-domain-containing protein [Westerdykella ornata]KAF2273644.1 FSH1-domain-containing protein [Westerdykella ornata]
MPRLRTTPQHTSLTKLYTRTRLRIMGSIPPPPSKPVKVLMLHGYTQSGPLFRAKTRALEKNLQKAFPAGITLHYPTAPIRLAPADVPFAVSNNTEGGDKEETEAWAWWRRKGDGTPYVYEGLEKGLAHIAEVLKTEGPFDGVIGFSQGGCAAGMLASLLDPGRREAFQAAQQNGGIPYPEAFEKDTEEGKAQIHPPLKFAVSYSGFAPVDTPFYQAFYEPKIKTPVLHFLGTLDTVVEEARSLALVKACENSEGRVVYHPGGHFLPSSQKAPVSALIAFMKEVLHNVEPRNEKEDSVEGMDVPF